MDRIHSKDYIYGGPWMTPHITILDGCMPLWEQVQAIDHQWFELVTIVAISQLGQVGTNTVQW